MSIIVGNDPFRARTQANSVRNVSCGKYTNISTKGWLPSTGIYTKHCTTDDERNLILNLTTMTEIDQCKGFSLMVTKSLHTASKVGLLHIDGRMQAN